MSIDYPHRRQNPLTGEWVLVSPHRALRPWLGQVEKAPPENVPAYDPDCYLCPGNSRAGGVQNPQYTSTFVFQNDFPALLSPEKAHEMGAPRFSGVDADESSRNQGLFVTEPEWGVTRVVCFSPRHDLSLPELSLPEVETVIQAWTEQTIELGALEFIRYVQVFENKGAMMGASNPHPHSQIWATSFLPNEPAKELNHQRSYLAAHDSCLLCEYLAKELQDGERLLDVNDHFAALVPFWAIWPFEVLVISRRHLPGLPSLTSGEQSALADIIRRVTTRYDNLFEISFPYSMGFHQAPFDEKPHPEWHFHAHYYPPLLRSATVRKFMVGFELLGLPQRDITPESAAEKLRSVNNIHYKNATS